MSSSLSSGERAALVSELTCPVCLQLYSQPVLLRCGHSFCLGCIQGAWSVQSAPSEPPKSPPGAPANRRAARYACPECRDEYERKPILQKNLKLFSVAERLRESLSRAAAAGLRCDCCPKGDEAEAVSTCLKCEISLCATHERPHREREAFANHPLVSPATRLHDATCARHGQPMRRYCARSRSCVCAACERDGREHAGHEHADIASASGDVRAELTALLERLALRERTLSAVSAQLSDSSRTLQDRVLEARGAATQSAESARRALDAEERAALALAARAEARALARNAAQAARAQRRLQRARRASAAAHATLALGSDIATLKAAAVIHKSLLGAAAPDAAVGSPGAGTAAGAGDEDDEEEEECSDSEGRFESELRTGAARARLLDSLLAHAQRVLAVFDVRMLRRYGCPLTFDSNSAHPRLLVSPDGRCVSQRGRRDAAPPQPTAFDVWPQLLSREPLAGPGRREGPSYWEVGVHGAQNWRVGVARGDSPRRGASADVCLGANALSWCLALTEGELSAWHDNRQTLLAPVAVPAATPAEDARWAGDAVALAMADAGCRGTWDLRAHVWECGAGAGKGKAAADLSPPTAAPASALAAVAPSSGLRRVGVLLDLADARLAFYDAECGAELHSFRMAGDHEGLKGPEGRMHAAAGLWDVGSCLTLYVPLRETK
ncbi:E3 ubiquitin-protein ligase TRIM11-like [Lampetra planeri]